MFEITTQYQELFTTIFKVIIYISCLLLMVIVAIYNALYLIKILNTNLRIGIHPPKHIHYLVRASIYLALVTAFILVLFLGLEVT